MSSRPVPTTGCCDPRPRAPVLEPSGGASSTKRARIASARDSERRSLTVRPGWAGMAGQAQACRIRGRSPRDLAQPHRIGVTHGGVGPELRRGRAEHHLHRQAALPQTELHGSCKRLFCLGGPFQRPVGKEQPVMGSNPVSARNPQRRLERAEGIAVLSGVVDCHDARHEGGREDALQVGRVDRGADGALARAEAGSPSPIRCQPERTVAFERRGGGVDASRQRAGDTTRHDPSGADVHQYKPDPVGVRNVNGPAAWPHAGEAAEEHEGRAGQGLS